MGPEQIEHINIVNWFNNKYPELNCDFHHFANERRCSIQQGRLLKRMGVQRGVSDFFLALPSGGYSGLWIELKVGAGKLSADQTNFINRKNSRGYLAVAVWGFDAAKEVISTYLKSFQSNCYSDKLKNCS